MIEPAEIEVCPEFTVDAGEHIFVKRRRHAPRIVVGGFEDLDVLLEIDPDEQAAARPTDLGSTFEKRDGAGGFASAAVVS